MTSDVPSPTPPAPVSPEPLLQMVQGLQVTGILQAGVQLGVFDQIAAGKNQATAIAAAIDADERGTRILLDALAALGLLERDDEGDYRLSPWQTRSSSPPGRPIWADRSTSSLPRGRGSAISGWQRWSVTAAPSSTSTPRRPSTTSGRRRTLQRGIIVPAAQIVAEMVRGWSEQRESLKILDVACGSGLISLTLASQHPTARTTLLDWANVLERTKDNVDRLGLHERTSYIEGDMFEVPLHGPYDLIIAEPRLPPLLGERCLTLLRRLVEVLKPDGRLVIQDFVSGSAPVEEPFPYLFSVRMLTWTREGEAHSLDTYRQVLREAGFSPPEVPRQRGNAEPS